MKHLFILLSLLFLFSCSKLSEDGKSAIELATTEVSERIVPIVRDYESIEETRVLRVAFMNTPTNYFVYKGLAMGFEYELLQRFAKDNELKLEIILVKNTQEAFDSLNLGYVDLVGMGLTVLKERKEQVDFTERLYETHQVLVQQKPENWRKMNPHTLEKSMLRDVTELAGKEINVRYASSFFERLINLENEIGGDIDIIEAPDSVSTAKLLQLVSKGKIKYTVADLNYAKLGDLYFGNLDVETPLSLNQKVSFSMRKQSPIFMKKLNNWIKDSHKSGLVNILYNKYYENERSIEDRLNSPYLLMADGKISPYDDLIKKYAQEINWDWRLLSALIFKESKFNPNTTSWVGAQGLMQLMPKTAASYGVKNNFDPEENIIGGIKHIQWLENIWKKEITDKENLEKFILASYNVGQGHVFDARRLAEKYGKDKNEWVDVEYYLLRKSNKKYYHDSVVKYGYCRGVEPVDYVNSIFQTYSRYKSMIKE